jgi:hypothetical protein
MHSRVYNPALDRLVGSDVRTSWRDIFSVTEEDTSPACVLPEWAVIGGIQFYAQVAT